MRTGTILTIGRTSRACLHSLEPVDCGGEEDEDPETRDGLLAAQGAATEAPDQPEQVFDLVAFGAYRSESKVGLIARDGLAWIRAHGRLDTHHRPRQLARAGNMSDLPLGSAQNERMPARILFGCTSAMIVLASREAQLSIFLYGVHDRLQNVPNV